MVSKQSKHEKRNSTLNQTNIIGFSPYPRYTPGEINKMEQVVLDRNAQNMEEDKSMICNISTSGL